MTSSSFPVRIQEVALRLLFVFVGHFFRVWFLGVFFWFKRWRAEMATFISVPLKKSSEVDLVKPLSKYITVSYPAGEEQAEYVRAVDELNKLRKNALGRPLDKHDSSLEILLRWGKIFINILWPLNEFEYTLFSLVTFISEAPHPEGLAVNANLKAKVTAKWRWKGNLVTHVFLVPSFPMIPWRKQIEPNVRY